MATSVAACCCIFISLAGAFNLDVRHALLLSDPSGQRSSYFGFSLALRKTDSTYTLVVGAPRANSSQTQHRGIRRPGVVYQCGTNAGTCKQLVMDLGGNRNEANRYLIHERTDSWLGASMAVTDSGNSFVTCAPRWSNAYANHRDKRVNLRMNGACYLLRREARGPETLIPLLDASKQVFLGNYHPWYIFGQAGLAVNFPHNTSELIIGAPGFDSWRGTVVRMQLPSSNIYVPRVRTAGYDYVGYSLSSGRFMKAEKRLLYVAGAPRGEGYKGKVLLFDFPSNSGTYLNVMAQVKGSQLGEYFGAALCVADLNGDGLDDLAVGAPLYSEEGDEGRVYIYLNNDKSLLTEVTQKQKIMGSRRTGSRFGTAIANAGDLNMDKKQDIAVGAPYEDAGVVYIYYGSVVGVETEPAQVIRAQDLNGGLRGLGMAFARGTDVDGNGVPDLAVGASRSGHAVLLRGRPIVTLSGHLQAGVSNLQRGTFNFKVDACLDYIGAGGVDVVNATFTLEVDPALRRAEFEGGGYDSTQSVRLRRGTPTCRSMRVRSRGPTARLEPLLLVMRFALAPAPPDRFCAACPVTDSRSALNATRRVAFESGCARDVCRPDLRVVASLDAGSELVLGERSALTLRVEVHNEGEPAYQARVTLQLPAATPLQKIPSTCDEVPGREGFYNLDCAAGNPLNSTYNLNLALETRDLESQMHNLTFHVNATSDGNDVNLRNNFVVLFLPVSARARMSVTGTAREAHVLYRRADGSVRRDVVLHHVYQVFNRGPSKVHHATLKFLIPKIFLKVLPPQAPPGLNCVPDGDLRFEERDNIAGDGGIDEEVLELDDEEKKPPPSRSKRDVKATNNTLLNCSDSRTPCVSVTCTGGPFPPDGKPAIVTLSMRPVLEGLGDTAVVVTRAKVTVQSPQVAGGEAGAEVSTTLVGKMPEGRASSWIIFIAIGVGILVLFLIVLGLRRLGFFRRRQKEEMEAMKEKDEADKNFDLDVVWCELDPDDGMQNPIFQDDAGKRDQQEGQRHEEEEQKQDEQEQKPAGQADKSSATTEI